MKHCWVDRDSPHVILQKNANHYFLLDQLSTDKKTIFIVKLREGHIHLKTRFIIIYFNYFFIIYKPGLNITQVLTFNIIQYFFQNSGTFRRLHP